jgi:hypothetical protein
MNWVRALWADEKATNRLRIGAITCVVVGVLLIIVGAVAGWGWTRIIGAGLITVGGGVLGVILGLAEPRREHLRTQIIERRVLIAVIVTLVLVLPVVLALVAAIIGLFGGGDRSAGLLIVGTIIALFLLAATAMSAVIAVRAVQRATYKRTENPQIQTGEGT